MCALDPVRGPVPDGPFAIRLVQGCDTAATPLATAAATAGEGIVHFFNRQYDPMRDTGVGGAEGADTAE